MKISSVTMRINWLSPARNFYVSMTFFARKKMITQVFASKSLNSLNNSNSFRSGKAKEGNLEVLWRPKFERLMIGKQDQVDLKRKWCEEDSCSIITNSWVTS